MTERSDSARRDRPGREPAGRGSSGSTGVALAAVAGLLAAAAGHFASGAAASARAESPGSGARAVPITGADGSASDTTTADPVPELGDVVRYRVAVRPDSASPETIWRVIQGPDVASLFSPSSPYSRSGDGLDLGAAWGVVGPAVGGRPWLVKTDRKALVAMWPDGPTYRPRVADSRGRSRVVLRGLDYRFYRGSSDREVAGRRAQHWVVEADVRLIFQPRGFGRRLGSDSAEVHLRTDFWFLREVPFSWAPLAASGVGALSIGVPPLARTLREDLEPHFRRLGLPVRTETVERWAPYGTPDVAMPSGARRGSRVEGLEAASPPAADPSVLEYRRIRPGQGQPSPPSSSRSSSSRSSSSR